MAYLYKDLEGKANLLECSNSADFYKKVNNYKAAIPIGNGNYFKKFAIIDSNSGKTVSKYTYFVAPNVKTYQQILKQVSETYNADIKTNLLTSVAKNISNIFNQFNYAKDLFWYEILNLNQRNTSNTEIPKYSGTLQFSQQKCKECLTQLLTNLGALLKGTIISTPFQYVIPSDNEHFNEENQLYNETIKSQLDIFDFPIIEESRRADRDALIALLVESVEKIPTFTTISRWQGANGYNQYSGEEYANCQIKVINQILNYIKNNWIATHLPYYCATYYLVNKDNKVRELETVTNDWGETQNKMSFAQDDIRIDMRDKQNNMYSIYDYNWSINDKDLKELELLPSSFPFLKIYELQPSKEVSFARISSAIAQAGSHLFEGSKTAAAVKSVSKGLSTMLEGFTKWVTEDIQASQDYASNIDWISDIIAGHWVGYYEIPFFSDEFLNAASSDQWSMGNALANHESLVNNFTRNVQDIPTWKFTQGAQVDWTNTIYLINDNIDNVRRNLKFLMAFTAGAYWVQEDITAFRSPNLYRIICPGRFAQLYAALNIKTTFVGKVRKFSETDAQQIFGDSDERFTRFLGQDHCSIPEAYKIEVKVSDLTPQCFNIVSNFFTDKNSKIFPDITTNQTGASQVDDQLRKKIGLPF